MSSIRQDAEGQWWLGRWPILAITAEYLLEREPLDQAMDDAVPTFELRREEIVYKRDPL